LDQKKGSEYLHQETKKKKHHQRQFSGALDSSNHSQLPTPRTPGSRGSRGDALLRAMKKKREQAKKLSKPQEGDFPKDSSFLGLHHVGILLDNGGTLVNIRVENPSTIDATPFNIPAIVVPLDNEKKLIDLKEEEEDEDEDPTLPPIKILSHTAAHQQTFTSAMFNTLKPNRTLKPNTLKTLPKSIQILEQKAEIDPFEDEPFLLAQGLSITDTDLLKPNKDEKVMKLGEDYMVVDIENAPNENDFQLSNQKKEENKNDLVMAVGDVDLSESGYRLRIGSKDFEAPDKDSQQKKQEEQKNNDKNTDKTSYTLQIAQKSSSENILSDNKQNKKEGKSCCIVS